MMSSSVPIFYLYYYGAAHLHIGLSPTKSRTSLGVACAFETLFQRQAHPVGTNGQR